MKIWNGSALLLALLVTFSGSASAEDSPAVFLSKANAKVAHATAFKSQWDGPETGVAPKKKGLIIMVAEDMQEPGLISLAAGVKEAAGTIGWNFMTMNCYGLAKRHPEAFSRAMALHPDGIILAGFDAAELQKEIKQAAAQKIPVLGWHATAKPGPNNGLFTNIGSDPQEVGEEAGLLAVTDAKGKAGVVVLTDNRSAYAAAKTAAISDAIKQCQACSLLGAEAMPADKAERAKALAGIVQKYGSRMTHIVSANDEYLDAVASLPPAISSTLQTIGAGDGTHAAYQRINQHAAQIGTVPEPLNMQGWQLVDEVLRADAGDKPSGYMPSVYLFTRQNRAFHNGPNNSFDPSNGYRDAYKKIWLK